MQTSPYAKSAQFIEDQLLIIDKDGQEVPFILNPIQKSFVERATGKDIILKARQQGFSSFILAAFTKDFLLKDNSNSVVVADKSDNATALLARVKFYLKRYMERYNIKETELLHYNSKYQLTNRINNATFTIGTAQEQDFGRSRTITNLHLSEAAFYPNLSGLLAGAAQAVVPSGKLVIETTANGFNSFKSLWDDSSLTTTAYKPLFFKASDFYDESFLFQKRKELGRLFDQEYPEDALHAFITSGDTYFDKDAMAYYLESVKNVKELSHV